MKKPMVLMLLAVAVFVAVLGGFKFWQIRRMMAQYANFQPPPEAVTTIVAKQETWPQTLHAVGSANAVRGVTVSDDLPGIVESINFDSGHAVKEGDVLVQLDVRQEKAQLAAAEAQLELARTSVARATGSLLDERGIAVDEAGK